jgi:hypothetical protein
MEQDIISQVAIDMGLDGALRPSIEPIVMAQVIGGDDGCSEVAVHEVTALVSPAQRIQSEYQIAVV